MRQPKVFTQSFKRPSAALEHGHGALVDAARTADLRVREEVPRGQVSRARVPRDGLARREARIENPEESAKDGIVDELLGQCGAVFGEVAMRQWGSYCIQHTRVGEAPPDGARAPPRGSARVCDERAGVKEGGKDTLDRVGQRMCESAKGACRAMIVNLALSLTVSQLIASVLPTADKDQRALLYDCIRGHIVTLRGCKTGSKKFVTAKKGTAGRQSTQKPATDLNIPPSCSVLFQEASIEVTEASFRVLGSYAGPTLVNPV
ncbi:hypothetical protein B0H14DRAFT_3549301 [Mycena olivaceomarginata]|nr:hypothetical protein B0H14DRAFT_3549301 [Mycena olivaceomarginata]